ncbi:MAG TPA: hypothetical protein VHY91_10375 [Pirellulales bacterium]|nr:hypothetical protein [Pirellulales bacterium]
MEIMKCGEFKVAKQIGPRGYFGKVRLEVDEVTENGNVVVEFDDHQASRWRTGARFGIDYVLDHLSKRAIFPNGIRVHVGSIEGHEVDTDNTVIAYVTAIALLSALGVEPRKRPDFDENKGAFIFPK